MHTAQPVWDTLIPESIRRHLAASLGLSDAETRALYCFLVATHDIGKVSPAFVWQASRNHSAVLDRMRDHGLDAPLLRPGTPIRHELVSQLALTDWLVARGVDSRSARSWACVVGGHHGRNPSPGALMSARKLPDAVGDGSWAEVRTELLDGMAALTGVDAHIAAWASTRMPLTTQMLLTALVVMADWMASDQDHFPYGDELSTRERAATAFGEVDVPAPWRPPTPTEDADALLRSRFPALTSARPLQRSLIDAALTCTAPPLLIVEGPMGVGKTEAAMLAAEVLAARFGQGGVFFGLPTMATANPMFTRSLAWLGHALGDADASVALAHGKAGLNDDYRGLFRKAWRGEVYDDDSATVGQAVVNAWLSGRRRAGLASFVVGTIDQALFAGLKAKHVALRHLGLAGKVVVIDEVHAADAYMRTYLCRVLGWLAAYGTPVILMSATLPPAQRDEFVRAYAQGRRDREPAASEPDDRYPRITCYDEATRDVPVPSATTGTRIALTRIPDEVGHTVNLLTALLADGGCAGVLCNTVGRAQEMYRALKEVFGEEVELVHSRFLAPERAARERQLVARLGPAASQRPSRLVVVGTQVLEQSLDIDFDVMVTDVVPVDLVLQRTGRLHRHAGTPRPPALREAHLYLRGMADWAATPPRPVGGSKAIYGHSALLRAAAVLDVDHLDLPTDIAPLVRQAYDPALAAPSGWEREWSDADAKALRAESEARGRAAVYLLAEPWRIELLDGLVDVAEQDPETAEAKGRSQVRDSEDSLEVIAVWRDDDGTLRLPACAPRFGGALLPTNTMWGPSEEPLARAMASCTLPLPRQLTHDGVIDAVITALESTADATAWQTSRWVAGQLVLAFDSTGSTEIVGWHLQYGTEGLTVSRPEENA